MGQPIIRYEAGQTAYPFEAATNAGDATVFGASFSPISNAAGAEPVVAPYGLLTGGAITPNVTINVVTVAALTASMAAATGADSSGVLAVATGPVTIVRPATAVAKISSITVTAAGALAAVAGTDSLSTAFSETRGVAGGPPLIPVGSIEIGQVRVTSNTGAVITTGQIYTVPGLHVERSDYPVYSLDFATGKVTFAGALPLIHTANVPKLVYIKGAIPLFAPIANTADWVPAESTYSISSTSTYDGPVGSASSSLGQASFTAIMKDGITDSALAAKGKNIWFEFRPDRDKLVPKQLTQGIFGVSRTFPAGGGSFSASCTVTPSSESVDIKA
jgi:hypothetical protein